MPRVCIIIIYFGPWPIWFSAWLRSCSCNPEFDWLILSNGESPKELPPNVKVEPLSNDALEQRVSEMLGVPFALSRGYKLVDLKPTYGELFQQYLHDYDFWGYTDLDVVYGRLADFFTEDRLLNHDVLSPSDRLLVGHLTLIRNTPSFCQLYRECPDYLQILCRDTHEGFDEKGFNFLVMSYAESGKLRLFLKDMKQEDILLRLNGRGQFLIVWNRGKLYDTAAMRQICHFHFMESKWNAHYSVKQISQKEHTFLLTPGSIEKSRHFGDFVRLFVLFTLVVFSTVPWYLRSIFRACIPAKFRGLIIPKRNQSQRNR
jgi:hypothetical protein